MLRNRQLDDLNDRIMREYYRQDSQAMNTGRTHKRSLDKTELSEEKRQFRQKQHKVQNQPTIKLSELMAYQTNNGCGSPQAKRNTSRRVMVTEVSPSATPTRQPRPNKQEIGSPNSVQQRLLERARQCYEKEIRSHTHLPEAKAKHINIQQMVQKQQLPTKTVEQPAKMVQQSSYEKSVEDQVVTSGHFKNSRIKTTPSNQRLPLVQNTLQHMISSTNSRYSLRLMSNFTQRRSSDSISINSRMSGMKGRRVKPGEEAVEMILEKIRLHLEIIDIFWENCSWIDEYYRADREWEVVKFYNLNRYYLEKHRVSNALSRVSQNCFYLKDIEVSKEELRVVHGTIQLKALTDEVMNQNNNMKHILEGYLKHLPAKPFSNQAFRKLNSKQLIHEADRELRGLMSRLEFNISQQERQIYHRRVIMLMQLVFLIEQLDGDYVRSFTDSEDIDNFEEYLEDNWEVYERVLDNRCP